MTGRGFGPDGASVTSDDSMHGGKADDGPFELCVRVESMKRREQLVGRLHREARTIVTNVEHHAVVAFRAWDTL